MKTFLRALALALALGLAAGMLAGCGGGGGGAGRATPELHPFKVEQVVLDLDDYSYISSFAYAGGTLYAVGERYEDSTSRLLTISMEGTVTSEITVTAPGVVDDNTYFSLNGVIANSNGDACLISNYWGSTPAGEGDDSSAESEYFDIYYRQTLSADGTLGEPVPVQLEEGQYLSTWGATMDAQSDLLLCSDGQILKVAPDGTTSVLPLDATGIYTQMLFFAPDGTLYLEYYPEEDWQMKVAPVDLATGKLGEPLPTDDSMRGMDGTPMFAPDGTIYLQTQEGIYTYDSTTGEESVLCNFLDSDISSTQVSALLVPMEDGSFLAVGWDDEYSHQVLSRLTYLDPADLPQKTVLTLGCIYSYDVQSAVLRFNRSSDTVRITIRTYERYNSEENQYTGAATQLNTDIISGNVPDILVFDSQLPFASYGDKGLFTDLYALLDADEEFSRDDLLPNVLAVGEYKGQLLQLIPSFGIATMVTPAQTSQALPEWTLQGFFDYLQAHPEVQAVANGTREEVLMEGVVFNGDLFADIANGTCDFDNPDFIRLLEHAAAYPEELDWSEGTYTSPRDLIAEGSALMMQYSLYEPGDMRSVVYDMGGPVSFVGFPTRDGSSGSMLIPRLQMAIAEACPEKEAAWEFLTYFLSDDYIDSYMSWSFSARADALDKKLEDAMKPPEGSGVDVDIAYDVIGDEMVDVTAEDYWSRPLTQGEADQVRELLLGSTRLFNIDQNMMDIINEEAASLYNGTKSAAEVARLIQSRCATYLAEQH